MQTFYRSFGNALSNYIKNKGIKQSFLVKNTGIDKTSISHYVNGKHEPGEKNKLLLEDLLGVEFVEEEPKKWFINDKNENDSLLVGNFDTIKPMDRMFDRIDALKKLYKKNRSNPQLSADELNMVEEMVKDKLEEIIQDLNV